MRTGELSLRQVMPGPGLGGHRRAPFGPATHAVPTGLYHDLATWEKIALLYSPGRRQVAADFQCNAADPVQMRRLASVLEHEVGHDIAFAVERAEIAANAGRARIDLGVVAGGLAQPPSEAQLVPDLTPLTRAIAGWGAGCAGGRRRAATGRGAGGGGADRVC